MKSIFVLAQAIVILCPLASWAWIPGFNVEECPEFEREYGPCECDSTDGYQSTYNGVCKVSVTKDKKKIPTYKFTMDPSGGPGNIDRTIRADGGITPETLAIKIHGCHQGILHELRGATSPLLLVPYAFWDAQYSVDSAGQLIYTQGVTTIKSWPGILPKSETQRCVCRPIR